MTDRQDDGGRVPTAAELIALDADGWAALLPHARAALHDLDDGNVDRTVERLRASPTSRLVGGRMREELAAAIAERPVVWRHLHRRLTEAAPTGLGWLIRGEPPPERERSDAGGERRDDGAADETESDEAPEAGTDQVRHRLREQARSLRRDLESARTRADGLAARVQTLEGKLEEARSQAAAESETVADLRARVQELEEELSSAVERERRRNQSELDGLREELRDRRREVHRLREELQRRDEERARRDRAAEEAGGSTDGSGAGRSSGSSAGLAVPGRPSELPAGVEPGTAEEVLALLTPGRVVLVDGYNLTITQRGHLELEQQRRWLMNLLGRVAARFDVEPQAVFDGSRGVRGPIPSAPRVSGWFSPEGVEADDEIDLAVAAMDPDAPVLVVTDDAELRERVATHGADVVGTAPFLWAVG